MYEGSTVGDVGEFSVEEGEVDQEQWTSRRVFLRRWGNLRETPENIRGDVEAEFVPEGPYLESSLGVLGFVSQRCPFDRLAESPDP